MSRIKLYALSVRNSIGRAFGLAGAYSKEQRANALAAWRVYRTRYDQITSAALLGCNEGECGFDVAVGGDKVNGEPTAYGLAQWHQARRLDILKHTGFDVWKPDAVTQARGLMAEISTAWPGNIYRTVERDLIDAPNTIAAKMEVLVRKFERSRLQDRDIARRTPFGEYWLKQDLDRAGDAVS